MHDLTNAMLMKRFHQKTICIIQGLLGPATNIVVCTSTCDYVFLTFMFCILVTTFSMAFVKSCMVALSVYNFGNLKNLYSADLRFLKFSAKKKLYTVYHNAICSMYYYMF